MHELTLADIHAQCVEEGDCLLWQGRLTSTGHPVFNTDGQQRLIKREVFFLTHGWLPEGTTQVVAATCGHTTCCEPLHLASLTRGQLVKRSYKKRNTAAEYGKRLAAKIRQGGTKLDLEIARAIRCDERTHAVVAAALGVSHSLVAKIRQGQIWREPASVFSTWGR